MNLYKNWLRYWKNSLADAQRLPLTFDETNSLVLPFSLLHLINGHIPQSYIESIFIYQEEKVNRDKGITNRLDPRWKSVETLAIHIALLTLNPKPEYLQFTRGNKPLYPFWIPAMLEREGTLQIHTNFFPYVCRDFLEPLPDESQAFVFSSVDLIDKAAALTLAKFVNWEAYYNYVNEVFLMISGMSLDNYQQPNYLVKQELTLVIQEETKGASAGIIALYEHLLHEDNLPTLLKRFISLDILETGLPFGVDHYLDFHSKHIGQMSSSFPLSISQRKSLYNFINSPNGTVFAVNGPPGTGKTTLLQSVVANAVVRAAIEGREAPLILACSANNQAVTNINESFSKAESNLKTLEGRWLPNFQGYATYLPSANKEELNAINYIKPKGKGTFEALEKREYLSGAQSYYLDKANTYLSKYYSSVDEVVNALQQEIKAIQNELAWASKLWKDLLVKEQHLLQLVDLKYAADIAQNPALFWQGFKLHLEKMEHRILKYFQGEPLLTTLLCLCRFPKSLKERELALKVFFRGSLITTKNLNLSSKVSLLEFFVTTIEEISELNDMYLKWQKWKKVNDIKTDPVDTEEAMWGKEYLKLKEKKFGPTYFYDELDVKHRHKAFQLAIHYWEGRWLQAMQEQGDKKFKRTEIDQKRLWRIRSMLTPCFVSTFYMAPKFFSYSLNLGKFDNPIWKYPPLLSFIDLLIVDESGQVSPEIGVAVFSLAKKAMVVGDVKQIEPIWNIVPKIDMGNLMKFDLLQSSSKNLPDSLIDKGFLASSGSIMKMAQNACHILEPQNKLKERGMILTEHRRCNDEIIQYCNDLAYSGMLKPMKGTAKAGQLFPSMLLLHVEGKSAMVNNQRTNSKEAEFIAAWLIQNKYQIESHYGADKKNISVEDLVGVITPFTGQKMLLIHQLRSVGLDTNRMKIGTVHALQGAEKEIILFSTVYGVGEVGTMFFDIENKPNMLNVAVSRAKETFIVVGNEQILNVNAQTPSGLLRRYLQKPLQEPDILVLYDDENYETDEAKVYSVESELL